MEFEFSYNQIFQSYGALMIKNLIKYYNSSIDLDSLLKMEISDNSLFFGNTEVPDDFDYLAYGVSNFFAEDKFKDFVSKSISSFEKEKEEYKKNKKTTEPTYPYEYMYAPFFIKKTVINDKIPTGAETFNYPLFLINVSHDNILSLLETIGEPQPNKEKSFFHGDFTFHPFAIIPKLGCLSSELLSKFMQSLDNQSMNSGCKTFEHLLFKMFQFIRALTQSSIAYSKEDDRSFLDRNKELILLLKDHYEKGEGQEFQKIEIFQEPWIILKTKDDTNYTKGLLNVYSSITQNGIKDSNLLISILKGNKHKLTSVPYEIENSDESTVILTKEDIVKFLGEQKGAFAKDFDLTYSQKFALSMSKRNLDVTPVNGPPGTGKTSLLRALIGDMTVENALKIYQHYKNGEKSLPFPTPIVSYSTNNKALENIVEGINDAFTSTYLLAQKEDGDSQDISDTVKKQKHLLYKRWINLKFAHFKDKERIETTINDAQLYVPFIKNGQSPSNTNSKIPLFYFDLKNQFGLKRFTYELNKNLFYYLDEWILNYVTFANNPRIKKEMLHQIPKATLLEIAMENLEKQIQENIKKTAHITHSMLERVSHQSDCFSVIKTLYEHLNMNEYSDGKITSRSDFEMHIFNINEKINFLKDQFEFSKKIIDEATIDCKKNIANLETNLINDMSGYNRTIDDKISSISGEQSSQFITLKERCEQNITLLRKNIEDIKASLMKSFWERIKISLAEKFNIEKFMDQRILEFEVEILKISSDIISSEEIFKETLLENISVIDDERKRFIEDLKKDKNIKERELIESLDRLILEEQNQFSKISGFDFNLALNKINNIQTLYNNCLNGNYFFIEDFEKEYTVAFANIDKTIRTENFFLAWHLLEGMLIAEFMRNLNIQSKGLNECFACGKSTLIREDKNDSSMFRCTSCKAIFVNKSIQFIERPFNDIEIRQLLTQGYVQVGENAFTLKPANDSNFWNPYLVSYTRNIEDIERNFRYISVFFPIVNTTCHSFGSVFNINDDTTVPESFIDTIFMDESGMILAPYLVNLYAGKKVILFGDEKQIEPVFPFKEHKQTCNDILISIHGKSKEEQDFMKNRMSAIKRTSMSIANDASYFKNPYVRNSLPGDLWLREHFRCSQSIIDFCNKHIYNGYILPLKPNTGEHLYFYDHTFEQEKKGEKGRINRDEAKVIISLVKKIIEKRLKENETLDKEKICQSIGIITPYAEQEKVLIKLINSERELKGVVAGTVHKFQGSERSIILFSSTIGPNTNNVGNLFFNQDSFNIINVAVSRAKDTFVLLGNYEKINQSPTAYSGLLMDHIQKHGKIMQLEYFA